MSSIALQFRFKIGMHLLNREKRCNAFTRSTYTLQVLNKFPTDKIHIRVPQNSLLCPTHVDNKKNDVFEYFLFKCANDQTSVTSL